MSFRTEITGHDVPQTEAEWKDCTGNDLCMLLNRDGMLTTDGLVRSSFIRNHIAMVRTNIEDQRKSSQVNVFGNPVITVEQRAANLRAAIVGELTRRGLPVPSGNGDNGRDGSGSDDSPPEAS